MEQDPLYYDSDDPDFTEQKSRPSNKKKFRNNLTIEIKAEIIKRLRRGERMRSLSKEYSVSKTAIWNMKKNESNILSFISKNESEGIKNTRKSMRPPNNNKLEKTIYAWYSQKRRIGEVITGPMLQAKALELNRQIGGSPKFKASNGWLHKFKQRHSINQLEIAEENLWPKTAADTFKTKFQNYITEHGYEAENVYTAGESWIQWKSLPQKITNTLKAKSNENRITILVATNVTGTNKIPLFLIGSSKMSQSVSDKTNFIYRTQSDAILTYDLFIDWYKSHFISNVKNYKEQTGNYSKVLLLIDYEPIHTYIQDLNSIDDNFNILCFPQSINVTSMIQPMKQGIMQKLKSLYRTQLINTLIESVKNEKNINQLLKKIDLNYGCCTLANAWNMITKENLMNSWLKLWPELSIKEEELTDIETDLTEIFTMIKKLPGCNKFTEADALEWLDSDEQDNNGQHLLNDDIIIENIDGNEPTHLEAISALETALTWAERQAECDSSLILSLNRLRFMALEKLQQNK